MAQRKQTIYQIDQSGKIEQTERHTVIACTGNTEITVLLRKTEKRKLQQVFKQTDNQKVFPYLTFAALLAILIKALKPKTKIVIDKEYFGHEKLIEEKIKIYLEELEASSLPKIEFGHVGKLSTAHQVAYQVARGKKVPTLIVNSKDVMKVILGTKKIGNA